jgi:glycosyltransferase involved in cell wall biosynthesis
MDVAAKGPRVSVVMPVYNAGRYLGPAVESILHQTFGDFELIAVNDGSTDGSLKMLQTAAMHDSRLRIITRENRGIVATLNDGLAAARGQYIARMDSDDIALPHRLAEQVAWLDAHPEVVVLGTAYDWVDEKARMIERWFPTTDHDAIERALLTGENPICHPSVMMRAAAVRAVGGYRPESWPPEDLDMWLRMAEVGRLAVMPKVLMQYRVHGGALSNLKIQRQIERVKTMCLEAQKKRGVSLPLVELQPWRPEPTRRSRHEFTAIWGWRAYRNRQFRTAFIYGLRAAMIWPMGRKAWQLMLWSAIDMAKSAMGRGERGEAVGA